MPQRASGRPWRSDAAPRPACAPPRNAIRPTRWVGAAGMTQSNPEQRGRTGQAGAGIAPGTVPRPRRARFPVRNVERPALPATGPERRLIDATSWGTPSMATQPSSSRRSVPRRRVQLTERDLAILRDLTRFWAMTVDQVARRHFAAVNSAANRLGNLVAAGFVRVERLGFQGRASYLTTPVGARLADVGLPAARYSPAAVRHRLAVVDLADALLASHPGAVWISERELRRDGMMTVRDRRRGQLLSGTPHAPDGVLVAARRPDGRDRGRARAVDQARGGVRRILRWYGGELDYRSVGGSAPRRRSGGRSPIWSRASAWRTSSGSRRCPRGRLGRVKLSAPRAEASRGHPGRRRARAGESPREGPGRVGAGHAAATSVSASSAPPLTRAACRSPRGHTRSANNRSPTASTRAGRPRPGRVRRPAPRPRRATRPRASTRPRACPSIREGGAQPHGRGSPTRPESTG